VPAFETASQSRCLDRVRGIVAMRGDIPSGDIADEFLIAIFVAIQHEA
jgi:hypothetical protein